MDFIMARKFRRSEYGAPEPAETVSVMKDKLKYHTDSWD